MKPKDKTPIIHLNPESPLAKGLLMMLEHKRLRERFWRGEITLDNLNTLLKEKGIPKQYEHSHAL